MGQKTRTVLVVLWDGTDVFPFRGNILSQSYLNPRTERGELSYLR